MKSRLWIKYTYYFTSISFLNEKRAINTVGNFFIHKVPASKTWKCSKKILRNRHLYESECTLMGFLENIKLKKDMASKNEHINKARLNTVLDLSFSILDLRTIVHGPSDSYLRSLFVCEEPNCC